MSLDSRNPLLPTLIIAAMLLVSSGSITKAEPGNRDPNVEALLAPLGPATNVSAFGIFDPDKSSPAYKRMVETLSHPDARVFQVLMTEVTNVGVLEKTSPIGLKGEAAPRATRLFQAFRIMGTNVVSLYPQLTNEFLSGRSVNVAANGLSKMGEMGWRVLVDALTNSQPRIQVAAAAVMQYVKGKYALEALPYLYSFTTNSSAPKLLRIGSEESIVNCGIDSTIKVPMLIQIADTDTNTEIRCLAIDGIGQVGVDSKVVRIFLQRVSNDSNGSVRNFATNALDELEAK